MVLFKRKPVSFLPRPKIEDEDAECWIIPETQEVFMSYESYLQRMDFLKQKRFICEITGHSGLSFFDALRSEAAGAKEVEVSFPDALKEPVLRKVQFSTVSRIDNLVDQIYDDFKHDFYPSEQVTVLLEDGQRLNGIVREKAKFPEIRDVDGHITREAFSRYFVKLVDRPNQETLVDDTNVYRDRKVFTKQMLRSFIKNTVTREAWNGAPWLVKPNVADWYRIDTNVPPHLQYGNKIAEKKDKRKSEQEGMFGVWQTSKLPELKPAPKGRKPQFSPEQLDAMQQNHFEEYQRALQADPAFAAQAWGHAIGPGGYNGYASDHAHGHFMPPNGFPQQFQQHIAPKQVAEPPPPPPIKYPIEDMDCEPLHTGIPRPLLKYVTATQQGSAETCTELIPGLQEKEVGQILEIWNTVNVYCQILVLDSFTFDDFVDAVQFSSSEIDCELFVEIHCAVLKKLVNSENDQNGALQVSLPDLAESEESEEEEEEEESRLPTPTPEPDVPARRTRSSLNKMALAEEEKHVKSPTPDENLHRAGEIFDDQNGWIQRLRKRDFRNGGWQLIMAGLLHQVAGRPRLQEVCTRILVHLAPLNAEPTVETVRVQYSTMDINLRVEALQVICQLFLETKTVRNFLEEMSNTMTQYRKLKIEHQRARKEAISKLKSLHDERRILAPQEKSPSPIPELDDTLDIMKMDETEVTEIVDSDDETPVTSRALRRGLDRAAERKRKRMEEQERREKVKEEKATKGSKEYQRVLKAIEKQREKIEECEESIETVDNDLREADCPRTRCLGKDRFCNRYWWFERNAMPYGGLPDCSTSTADYANGRVWVQGPDDMERLGYLDVPDEARNNYYRCFQMTPIERKTLEEGPTGLQTACQWGFYDDIDDIDKLIEWLDPRGHRELKLKKELTLQRDLIKKYLDNRKAYLTFRESSSDLMDKMPISTRMSTRTKIYVSEDLTQTHRCLKWRNSIAIDQLGHRHVDPPPPAKQKGKKVKTVSNIQTRKDTTSTPYVAMNRQGKPVSRQGGRYNF